MPGGRGSSGFSPGGRDIAWMAVASGLRRWFPRRRLDQDCVHEVFAGRGSPWCRPGRGWARGGGAAVVRRLGTVAVGNGIVTLSGGVGWRWVFVEKQVLDDVIA